MPRNGKIVSTIIAIIAVIFVLIVNLREKPRYSYTTVVFKKSADLVQVYVPENSAASYLGLGKRLILPEDYGMLWRYREPALPAFVMRGMKIPLDFIWIRDGKITGITPSEPARSKNMLRSSAAVTEVLEVNAGYAARHQIEVGDAVYIAPWEANH